MPNKCGIVNCNGNYNPENRCRVFALPSDDSERQRWINVLPPRENFTIPKNFYVCERHWPSDTDMMKTPGGFTRPKNPPSVWPGVPRECLPTPKPPPRRPIPQDRQEEYHRKKDAIGSFENFTPEKELLRKYDNIFISHRKGKLVCFFMTEDFSESTMSIVVHNKSTLCSPLTLTAFKHGIRVPLSKQLNPNNGFSLYSQFFEAVNTVVNYQVPSVDVAEKVVATLQELNFDLQAEKTFDAAKEKKLLFLTRQLQLLCEKSFTVPDFCFAVESYPRSSYEQLREVLVLPSKRRMQTVISSTGVYIIGRDSKKKRERERKRHTDKQTDRQRHRDTETG